MFLKGHNRRFFATRALDPRFLAAASSHHTSAHYLPRALKELRVIVSPLASRLPLPVPQSHLLMEWYKLEEDGEADKDEEEADEDEEEVEKEDDEWLGVVEWMDVPFADPGDLGSLIFTIFIPLGIHVGSPSSMPNTSIFISLDTFCLEAEAEGLEPHFCY